VASEVSVHVEREGVARADAVNGQPVERRAGRAAGPAPTEQRYLVPASGEAPEDLVEVDLRPAGLGVLTVLPIDEQNAH
jgi:hypothetical protein